MGKCSGMVVVLFASINRIFLCVTGSMKGFVACMTNMGSEDLEAQSLYVQLKRKADWNIVYKTGNQYEDLPCSLPC